MVIFIPAEALRRAESIGGEFGYSPEFLCKFASGVGPVAVKVARLLISLLNVLVEMVIGCYVT